MCTTKGFLDASCYMFACCIAKPHGILRIRYPPPSLGLPKATSIGVEWDGSRIFRSLCGLLIHQAPPPPKKRQDCKIQSVSFVGESRRTSRKGSLKNTVFRSPIFIPSSPTCPCWAFSSPPSSSLAAVQERPSAHPSSRPRARGPCPW